MSDDRLGYLDWLEQVFFGGMELSVLSTPAFTAIIVLQQVYPDAVPVAGLLAIPTGSVALALYRNGAIDVGEWPRRSELFSVPLRLTYFSLVFFLATMGVAYVTHAAGSWWLILLGIVVQALGLAAFPSVYRAIHGSPNVKPAARI